MSRATTDWCWSGNRPELRRRCEPCLHRRRAGAQRVSETAVPRKRPGADPSLRREPGFEGTRIRRLRKDSMGKGLRTGQAFSHAASPAKSAGPSPRETLSAVAPESARNRHGFGDFLKRMGKQQQTSVRGECRLGDGRSIARRGSWPQCFNLCLVRPGGSAARQQQGGSEGNCATCGQVFSLFFRSELFMRRKFGRGTTLWAKDTAADSSGRFVDLYIHVSDRR